MSFITEVAPHAQKIGWKYNILPSLILAQACLESNFGKSGLAIKGKNLFGVKGEYQVQSIKMQTKEQDRNGKVSVITAKFRKYPTWTESFEDHALLLVKGVSWDRSKYHGVIGEKDYQRACIKMGASGYATDIKYAEKLIGVIQRNFLTQYDKEPIKEYKPAPSQSVPSQFHEGQKVTLQNHATHYSTGQEIPAHVKNKQYTIKQVTPEKVLLAEIMSWVWYADITPKSAPVQSQPYRVIVPNTAFFQAAALVGEYEKRGFKCEGVNLNQYAPYEKPKDHDPYKFVIDTTLDHAKQLVIELHQKGYPLAYGEAK
ncbi:glycoside hydrolase family 73 protein [Bacillus sp. 03113]|uniref:glycoside hydrolase family 73 protein n=1 Tax=Bacillus sp. 03113 TaxID=2578211 RepID=UPI001143AC43|nr:glycoside hydrolase family 73 protein [Bacillus sp. 03113]